MQTYIYILYIYTHRNNQSKTRSSCNIRLSH